MNSEKIVNFLFEIASLRRLTRSHRQVIQGVNDNISDHSFRVAIIGMILAELEDCDTNKVMRMCLFHDLVEARTGDANSINKFYVKLDENQARKDQMKEIPLGDEILCCLEEYEELKTKEAIIAKDADVLDQMILQQEYFYSDQKNRKIWQNHNEKRLKTESAKKIAAQIKEANPFRWFYQLVEEKTGKKVEVE